MLAGEAREVDDADAVRALELGRGEDGGVVLPGVEVVVEVALEVLERALHEHRALVLVREPDARGDLVVGRVEPAVAARACQGAGC